MPSFKIASRPVGDDHPTWFIADISANHDGDLERAKALVHLAAASGADAAKFQNFRAETIVSDHGFRSLGTQQSHQAKWKKSVSEVYKSASLPWEWTPVLKAECDRAGITFFSAPYDLEAIDMLDPFMPAYKVGSGDITWLESIERMAAKGKPVLLATGASAIGEVQAAVQAVRKHRVPLGLMQCNTNYTASLENFRHCHLRVLTTYRQMFPDAVLGLSDHTPGCATVLGSIALGARLIEKHFTDDNSREGPDHTFSMSPASWREMVDRTRELEYALGSPEKFVAENERETVVIQRRCLRATADLPVGTILTDRHFIALRPAPADGLEPTQAARLIGKRVRVALVRGQHITHDHVTAA
ncbi:MAG TPA: N-acetylneuraminate synthase family protein [Lacunisphaera sp.]|nr:N-acetylneuraminate synthase family protein [Lacunisphaera sp.]